MTASTLSPALALVVTGSSGITSYTYCELGLFFGYSGGNTDRLTNANGDIPMLESEEDNHFTNTALTYKKALHNMQQFKISMTPENYSVWYQYSSGTNPVLSKVIDELIISGNPFTQKVNHHLAVNYICSGEINYLLDHLKREFNVLVGKLSNEVKRSQGGTKHLSTALLSCRKELKKAIDIPAITHLVSFLTHEIEKVDSCNREMEAFLNSVDDDIEVLKVELVEKNIYVNREATKTKKNYTEAIETLLSAYRAEKNIFSLLMVDIDHFKQFNYTFGTEAGDKVLAFLAASLRKNIKKEDIVINYSAEKFAIFLPHVGYDCAMAVGERLREIISHKRLTLGAEDKKSLGNITVSVGVAHIGQGDDGEAIIQRALKALDLAKKLGRNQVVGERRIFSR